MVQARVGFQEERFSPVVIRFCWACFVLLHVAGLVYYGFTAWCYWNLPDTHLDAWLTLYYLGMETQYDRTIAMFMGTVAIIHGLYLVWMISWSFKKRQLVFAIYNVFRLPSFLLRFLPARKGSRSVHPKGISNDVYRAFFTRDGLLGVDGPYFDMILFIREVVETALQTHQAYRMSLLLPRIAINRCYVALLVINCWAIALVHNMFHENSTKRRVWSLISDCVLDTVTSIGISTVLLISYINDFNFERNGFPVQKWYEDEWVVQALSEFQMILVTSWRDLFTRLIFAVSLFGDMDNMKMAMRAKRAKRTSITTGKSRGNRATMIAPYSGNGPNANLVQKNRAKDLLFKVSQFVFFVWGITILTLHLYAESIQQYPQCWMKVRPWFTGQPSCSLLVLDCHEKHLRGTKREVTEQWIGFDPESVTRTVVRHCPALELPEVLTAFSRLNAIKMYNTTIASWDSNAALTQTNQTSLMTLFLIRVNFSLGELPAGLQSPDFPQSLGDIEICITNLRSFPDDIDMKWPRFGSIYIEASQLHEVPASLVRLAPFDLSLSMNPISVLPPQLFEEESVAYLSFGGTLITQLPENVTKLSSSLGDLNLSYNNLSFLWSWIDPIIDHEPNTPLSLAGTPYCRDLERIFTGEQTNFLSIPPLSQNNAEMSIFADASVGNWATLKKSVSCAEQDRTWYPIDFEDQYSSIRIVDG
ncbi:hypothetical protein F442_19452 [Phytophthora nicotianae P10297]|uniref:Uncharacterized protein n=1 Tax=Phytophthora nicotianae P10297 TaxID=1317064 RepID=W2YAR2_PHYNI|nr:hypothetical protein F442_19452 [Phytophthora nicotianae P10297]